MGGKDRLIFKCDIRSFLSLSIACKVESRKVEVRERETEENLHSCELV